MEPFGPENPRPVFIAGNVEDSGHSKVVKEQHIRFSLKQGNQVFNGIGFNVAGKYRILEQKMPIDLLFTLDENEWNDQKNLQLKVMDLRLSGPAI